jgi:hypothetical protein
MIKDVWLTERKKIETFNRKTSTDTSWSVNSPLTPFWDDNILNGSYCFACLQNECICIVGDETSLRDNISNLTFNDSLNEMTGFLNEDLYSQSAPSVDHFGLTLNSPVAPLPVTDNVVHFDRRRAVTLDTLTNKRSFEPTQEARQRKKSSTSIISSSSSSTCLNFPKLKPAPKLKTKIMEEFGEPTPQNLRFENDFYTPRFVRGSGKTKQGLCPHCIETEVWLVLKNSSYGYFAF